MTREIRYPMITFAAICLAAKAGHLFADDAAAHAHSPGQHGSDPGQTRQSCMESDFPELLADALRGGYLPSDAMTASR